MALLFASIKAKNCTYLMSWLSNRAITRGVRIGLGSLLCPADKLLKDFGPKVFAGFLIHETMITVYTNFEGEIGFA